ncbi:MAG: site-specific integrase [Bacteroidales bacterium]|nr:site-specific integrase [Bacteroidales bacterium]
MKINVRFFPDENPDNPGRINYQIINRQGDVASINTPHRIYVQEWNHYRNTIRFSRKNSPRKEQLKEIADSIKCDIMKIHSIYDDYVMSGEPFRMVNVANSYLRQRRSKSFFNFMLDAIDNLTEMNRYGTAHSYSSALKSFMNFRENVDVELIDIDSDLMQRYEAYLENRGVSPNTVSFYMRNLRAVYNRAIEKDLIPMRNPFRHVYTGIAKTVKRALPLKALQRIRTLNLANRPSLDFARDMFMFSFYTRGMSFIDMANLKTDDIKYNTLYYRRHKTGQQLQIRWERCMQEIVDKYKYITVAPFLLPISESPDDPYPRYKCIMSRVNKYLKRVALLANIDAPLTMYVARHSWASVARDAHIPISIISQGMGHDSELTTQIYLATINNVLVDRANKRIITKLCGNDSSPPDH